MHVFCHACDPPPDPRKIAEQGTRYTIMNPAECLERHGADAPDACAKYEEVLRQEEEKRRREEGRRKAEAVAERLRRALAGLPVEVWAEQTALGWEVLARLARCVEDFDRFVRTCRRLGLKYDRNRRVWRRPA